jgi:hypothetical protein
MPGPHRRLVIVRRGATELYEQLEAQFREDPDTVVLWDRRLGAGRRRADQVGAVARQTGDRRLPQDPTILVTRGFWVTRAVDGRRPRVG